VLLKVPTILNTINMHTIFKVFVDTNIFVAIRNKNDLTHQKAVELFNFLKAHKAKFYTSSDIISESLTVLSVKMGKKIALEFLEEIGSNAKEIFIDEVIHRETRNFFKKVKSKNISFVDCSSAVAMKRNNIKYIFSFDEDFKKLGVKLLEDVV